ncbi:MAG: PQQ-dependent sugar dehydrogenase [Roseimicrobium sp.]
MALSFLVATGNARAATYGLDKLDAVAPYLNGKFPPVTPSTNDLYGVENAFPSIVFDQPMFLMPYPNSNRLMMVRKPGTILRFENRADVTNADTEVFLDISDHVYTSSDSGMTGLVFHPEYGQAGSPNRGYVYVTYKWQPQGLAGPDYAYLRLSRFTVPDGQTAADVSSELVLFQQLDRQQWHDAGCLMFGMDGYLYFSVGDEGGANDQYDVGQRMNERLMTGIFRIDVDRNAARSHPIRRQPFHHPDTPAGWPESFTANYYVPNDNPFVNPDGSVLEEYYAIGLRNPYRFSQDKVTGQIWVGDVGQDTREEVDILQAGANYQWPFGEGMINGPKSKPSPVLGTEKQPIWDYPHGSMGSCIIGGYVYRGTRLAELAGQYICVDNTSGAVYAISNGGQSSQAVERISTMPSGAVYGGTSSCGVDANGELYFLKFGGDGAGGVYRLRQAQKSAEAPALLSQTGAFTDLAKLTPAAGLIPYSVNNPLWSDGAEKSRWIAIPNDGNANGPNAKIAFAPDNEWSFPEGTVFVKHFELGVDEKNATMKKRVETRFLVLGQNNQAYGVTYRWRDDGTDADLLTTSATQNYTISTSAGGTRTQTWSFRPGRTALSATTLTRAPCSVSRRINSTATSSIQTPIAATTNCARSATSASSMQPLRKKTSAPIQSHTP